MAETPSKTLPLSVKHLLKDNVIICWDLFSAI